MTVSRPVNDAATDCAVYLFHRDLRMTDNTTLNVALENEKRICLVFICDPVQIDSTRNKFFSNNACQFMCESLLEIPRLNVFVGDTITVLQNHIPKFKRLYQNLDLSKFAVSRDARIRSFCEKNDVDFIAHEDYSLFARETLRDITHREHPYVVFSPFYKLCVRHISAIPKPHTTTARRVDFVALPNAKHIDVLKTFYQFNAELASRGGRKNAERLLSGLHNFKDYPRTRDFPALNGTTKASAHLKFGTMSIREMLWTCVGQLGEDHALVRELFFREFYFHIYSQNPLSQRGHALNTMADHRVNWSKNGRIWRAWQRGMTGYPLVDAGMRELNATGWMHNRCRMIVSNFLSKLCGIDWRLGMTYFYTHLVDCDAFSNAAGWQWSAGVGADAQPPFRVFNPFLQSRKFDKDAAYIKRWIPELRDVSPRDIHSWNVELRSKYPDIEYPFPVIDYATASRSRRCQLKRTIKLSTVVPPS